MSDDVDVKIEHRQQQLDDGTRDDEFLKEISIIDGLLTNVDDEATITNEIETDLEFLCDILRKRQLFVGQLSLKENVNKVNRNFDKELIHYKFVFIIYLNCQKRRRL